jgi:tetratricopeptide (TPR) repeat protein
MPSSLSVAQGRITEIWSDSANGSFGSGYLLGGGLILTARHVVMPEGSEPPTVIKARPLGIAHLITGLQPADLVWPDLAQLADLHAPDAVLLRLRDLPMANGTLPRFGRPDDDGGGRGTLVSATGFPAFADKAGGRRDTEEISGVVFLGTRLVAGRYEIKDMTVRDREPLNQALDWHGMSGAALLSGGQVIGVLIARKQANQRYDFSAVRIETLLAIPEFVTAIRGHVALDHAAVDREAGAAAEQIVHPNVEENPSFAGREEDLARIDAALSAGRTAALTNSGHAAALSGLGGVGKSVLAREFAWRNRGRYQGVWWVRAEKPETLLEDLIELGSHSIPGLQEAKDRTKAASAALDHIWQGKFPLPWLIVYDNVEKPGDLEHLTPRGGAHILITSRCPHWDEAAEIAIDVFPRDVAIQYLMKRARKNDPEGADRLAEALGDLPLALDHAGSYLRNGLGTFDGYIRDLAEFLKRKPGKGKSRGQYPDSVHGTFNLALNRVIAGDPDRGITAIPEAEQLMQVLAFLAPDQIPLDFIPPEVLPDIQKGDAAAVLQEASLLRIGTFEDGRPHVSVHLLVQQVMRSRLEETGQLAAAAAHATKLAWQAFDRAREETMHPFTLKDRLLPHALTVLGHAPVKGSGAAWTGYLCNETGDWQLVRGDTKDALTNYQKALAIAERLAKADPGNAGWQRDLSVSHDRIGDVLRAQGDLAAALQSYRASLAIAERLAKADPGNAGWQRDLSVSHERIGDVLRAQGDLAGVIAESSRKSTLSGVEELGAGIS